MMKEIIAVISGKGGVGKSTVAVNLAVAMAAMNKKVALLDADFYGPSIPVLFGGGEIRVDQQERLIPPEKFGVKYVSLGFFLSSADEAVIWRGPMFNKALTQLLQDVSWGDVDCCVVDMPPGTGDAQLSLAQLVKLSGALVVTTPQEVALSDVRKAINMLAKVNVPVLGIVENMAGFVTADGTRHDIFGSGGGQRLADQFAVPLLASIPIDPALRESGDRGEPAACNKADKTGQIFSRLALQTFEILDKKALTEPAVKIVN